MQMMCQNIRITLIVNIYLLIFANYVYNVYGMCPRGCLCDDIKLETICESVAQLDYVPHTLNPALKKLRLFDNHIRGIKSSLSVYRNLQLLDISKNQLQSLGEDNFLENSQIHTIVLNKNSLTSIQNNTFKGLSSLEKLQLNDNNIDELNANAFKPLIRLESLDLSQNQISFISLEAFVGLKRLKYLNLRRNQLNIIPSNAFQNVPNLRTLDLSYNSLTNVSNHAFSSMPFLDELSLEGCSLHHIEWQAFKGLSQLSILRLQNNKLEEIPSKAFLDINRLEDLQIGQNYFKTLSANIFSNLKHLKTLEINDTKTLSSVEFGAFDGITNLERLKLSQNKLLKSLDPYIFNGLQDLRYLNLSGNAFTTLQLDLFNNFERKIYLDLRDNPLNCNCSLEWLRSYLLQNINSSVDRIKNSSIDETSYTYIDFLTSVSRVKCESPPTLKSKFIIDLQKDEFGCFQLDTKVPIIIAILIGVLLICGVIIIFVIRCKYGLTSIVKNQWFSGDSNGNNSNSLRNDLNYRKPDFVFIPNIDLNIDDSNRAIEEAVRYPLKMTPITEL